MNLNAQCCTSKLILSITRARPPDSRLTSLVKAGKNYYGFWFAYEQNRIREPTENRLPCRSMNHRIRYGKPLNSR